MNCRRLSARFALVLALQLIWAGGWAGIAAAEDVQPPGDPIVLAQEGGTEPRELEPRYEPPPPGTPGPYNEQDHDYYNSDYLFGMTRGVANSTIVPALKAPLFLFTIPLDIVFLPFTAIGGFFG
jgi:hypothetical protein